MTPLEIEQEVYGLDQIRIVIRAPASTTLGDYRYARRAADNASISEWLDQRIKPILGIHTAVVIDGKGNIPHGRTRLSVVRESYAG